jgi:hypothetical protein
MALTLRHRIPLRRGIQLLSALKYLAFPALPLASYFVLHGGIALVLVALVCVALHAALRVWETSLRRRFIREATFPRFLGAKLLAQYPQLQPRDVELVLHGLRQFFIAYLRSRRKFTDRHFNHMRPSIAPQNSLRTTGISSQSHSGALVGSAAAKKSVVQENDFHRAGCARHRDTPQSACLTTLACHQLIR